MQSYLFSEIFAWLLFGHRLTRGFSVSLGGRLRLLGTNWALFHRNRVRRRHAALLLRPLPPPPLARKLEAARKRRHRAKPTVGGEVYYSSAKSLLEQAEVHNPPLEAWDDALGRRNRPRRT